MSLAEKLSQYYQQNCLAWVPMYEASALCTSEAWQGLLENISLASSCWCEEALGRMTQGCRGCIAERTDMDECMCKLATAISTDAKSLKCLSYRGMKLACAEIEHAHAEKRRGGRYVPRWRTAHTLLFSLAVTKCPARVLTWSELRSIRAQVIPCNAAFAGGVVAYKQARTCSVPTHQTH